MGDGGIGLLRKRENRTPPARVHSVVPDRKESKHGDGGDQGKRPKPAETLFQGFTTFHALFANIRGKGGPAVGCWINRCTLFIGSFEEAVSPIAGVKTQGAGISANDAFAQDAAWKLLIAILFKRHKVALADLGDSGDLLERNAARNPLCPKLFPKSTHLVTSLDIIA
jgi:hypothetical protein